MKLCGALCMLMTLSTAFALRCYSCMTSDSKSCTNYVSCPAIFDRCFSLRLSDFNMVTKGCQSSVACVSGFSCCKEDLCNSTATTGFSIVLLLVSLAIISLLL